MASSEYKLFSPELFCFECKQSFAPDEDIYRTNNYQIAHIKCLRRKIFDIQQFTTLSFNEYLEDYLSERLEEKRSEIETENKQLKQKLSEKTNQLNSKEIENRVLKEEAERSRNLFKDLEIRQGTQLESMHTEVHKKLGEILVQNLSEFQQLKQNMEYAQEKFEMLQKMSNEKECDKSEVLSGTHDISAELSEYSKYMSIYKPMTDEESVSGKSFEGLPSDLYKKCIIIQNAIMKDTSPVSYVLKLANILKLPVNEADIEKAFPLEGNINENIGQRNENVLAVIFKKLIVKKMFLLKKENFKFNQDTERLVVQDYRSHETINIFNFAKVLQEFGYENLLCKNDEVFVQEPNKLQLIKIYSTKHVEDLLKSTLESE